MDEFATRKGYKSFVTTLVDIDRRKLLQVVNGHKQKEIIEALEALPQSLREQVEEVSIDMWGGFVKVVKRVFPKAEIVYDHFHVIKKVNQELNKLRKILKVKEKGLPFLLWKNKEELDEEEREKLESSLKVSPCLRIAYELKEELREIYKEVNTVKSGKQKMKKWIRNAEIFLYESAAMLKKHLEGVCNYFRNRTTSGVTEGINTKIKLIKRQAYGLPLFGNLRLRLLSNFCG